MVSGIELQATWSASMLTVGVGLTVIVNDMDVPLHVFDCGVTVTDAYTGKLVVLDAAKAAMFPGLVEAIPTLAPELTQLYTVLATFEPVNVATVADKALQATTLEIAFTEGVGLIVIV